MQSCLYTQAAHKLEWTTAVLVIIIICQKQPLPSKKKNTTTQCKQNKYYDSFNCKT